MNTNTESHGPSEKAQATTNSDALHEQLKSESSSEQPEAIASEPQEPHDAGNDLISSPGLPASKARCIALVATVTGATFLNVKLHHLSFELITLSDMDYRHLRFNQLLLYFQQLQMILIYPPAGCNG